MKNPRYNTSGGARHIQVNETQATDRKMFVESKINFTFLVVPSYYTVVACMNTSVKDSVDRMLDAKLARAFASLNHDEIDIPEPRDHSPRASDPYCICVSGDSIEAVSRLQVR